MKKKFVLLFAILVSACAQPVKHDTPSGKPEICIKGSKSKMVNFMENSLIDRGYTIKESSKHAIVAQKLVTSGGARFAYGTLLTPDPTAEVMFNLTKGGNCNRVVADISMISNIDTDRETRKSFNESAESTKVQNWLRDVQSAVE